MKKIIRRLVFFLASLCSILLAVAPRISFADLPNDPEYDKFYDVIPWNIPTRVPGTTTSAAHALMGLPSAWDLVQGIAYVAIPDNGINADPDPHPDLKNNVRLHFSRNTSAAGGRIDEGLQSGNWLGHGTHVAGILAASAKNGKGSSGVCWLCSLMILRVTPDGNLPPPPASCYPIIDALYEAIDNGAQIISFSQGVSTNCPAGTELDPPIAKAAAREITIAAAAGNTNEGSTTLYPARHPYVISVAATDASGTRAPFSITSPTGRVDLAAPGDKIFSTFYDQEPPLDPARWAPEIPDFAGTSCQSLGDIVGSLGSNLRAYGYCSGTSMSTPMIAGAAAILRSANPLLTDAQTKSNLRSNARAFNQSPQDVGSGVPNVGLSVADVVSATTGNSGLTPLFILNNPDLHNHLYTTVPQMASAAISGTLRHGQPALRFTQPQYPAQGVTPHTPTYPNPPISPYVPASGEGSGLAAYASFPGVNGTPIAAVNIFTTVSRGGITLRPLYRLSWAASNTPGPVSHAYLANPAELSAFQAIGYVVDGIEGYLYPPDITPPSGTVGLYRRVSGGNFGDYGLFTASQLTTVGLGYQPSSIGAEDLIGYACPNTTQATGICPATATLVSTPLVSLSSSVNPSAPGQSVMFTTTVSGSTGTPTGTVTFKDGASAIGGCGAVTLVSGQATCTTSALTAGTHSITALYSGNASYNSATSSVVSQTVATVTPIVSLSSLPNPSAPGQNVTFTTAVSGSAGTPTGTVTLNDGTSAIAGCSALALVSGQVTCTTSTLVTGTHSVTAQYSGNASYNPATSNVVSQTVATLTPAISLSSSPNPSTPGQNVTFTASVSGNAGTPTGTVTFNDGASVIGGCSAVALVSGQATCTTSTLATGTHSITAQYSGSTSYNAATSNAISQTVAAVTISTNVALASAGASVIVSNTWNSNFSAAAIIDGDRTGNPYFGGGVWMDGQPDVWPKLVEIDFAGTKTINRVILYSPQDNYNNPSEPSDSLVFTNLGSVDFSVNGWNGSSWVTLASVTNNNLVKAAVSFAPFTTSRIQVSITRTLTSFARIAEIEAWTPGTIPPIPAMTLTSSANPSALGQSVTFSASVSGSVGTPTGTVTFKDGGNVIAGCVTVTLVSGQATCTTTALIAGTHSITARYSGDGNYNTAISSVVSQTVSASGLAPPTAALSFNSASILVGNTTTLTITLSNSNATAITAAAFAITHPAGLTNAAAANGSTTCTGGTVTAANGGSSVSLSGGTIPASGSCTVTVTMAASTAGSYVESIAAGGLTTANAGSNAAAASATLTVATCNSSPVNYDYGGAPAPGSYSSNLEAPTDGYTFSMSFAIGTGGAASFAMVQDTYIHNPPNLTFNVSQCKGDFVTPSNANCFQTGTGGFFSEMDVYATGTVPAAYYCVIQPGVVYYLNMRADSCVAGTGNCGFQIWRRQ